MKKKLFRLALLVTFVCALLIAGAAADGIEPKRPMDGDGTAANPYQISTAKELYWFAQHVNAGRYDACAMLVDEITVNERVLTESGELVSDIDSLHRWTATAIPSRACIASVPTLNISACSAESAMAAL